MGLTERVLGKPYVIAPQQCKRTGQNCDVCKTFYPVMPPCLKETLKTENHTVYVVKGRVK